MNAHTEMIPIFLCRKLCARLVGDEVSELRSLAFKFASLVGVVGYATHCEENKRLG